MLGLAYEQLYELTPRSFNNTLKGYNNQAQANIRESWERTRVLAHIIASPNLKRPLKPKQFLPLPWDNENIPNKIIASPEQIKADVARHKEILKKMQK